ncbi:MAG: hypothetical protein JW829_14145 [Pirellulales bacterium]|nr:hypothetical protein [Pirellulales bacterium]
MSRTILIFFVGSILGLVSTPAPAEKSVTFLFDPADFYAFLDLGPGGTDYWSNDGGMFKLHEVYGQDDSTVTTLRSWKANDRPSLDAWKASLSAGEGIGLFNINLNQLSNAQAWGQVLPDVLSIDSVIAPSGWSTNVQGINAGWIASSASNYIRPGSSAGKFGFLITVDDSLVLWDDYTIWFGGFNSSEYGTPSVTFNADWGGDPNEYASRIGNPGSGFEATLRLTALGESTADFDQDGDVDGQDFLSWQTGFGGEEDPSLADGDANRDGDVDGDDLAVWLDQFGTTATMATLAIPEPSSCVLLLAALVGSVVLGRCRG